MMRYMLIQNGVAVNAIVLEPGADYDPDGELVASETAPIGATWDGQNLSPEFPE